MPEDPITRMPRKVSETLRAAIRARGLSAYMLSRMAGVGADPIQRFVNGERGLNSATLDRICATLGLTLASCVDELPQNAVVQGQERECQPAQREGRESAARTLPGRNLVSTFFTVATTAQANLDDTARLLFNHGAIWLPPMSIPPAGAVPQPGDQFWLLYQDGAGLRVLAGGPLAQAPRVIGPTGYTVLWNDADRPGLRADARSLGYRGPNNMTFVRLDPPRLFALQHAQPVVLPGTWHPGLNLAAGPQSAVLQAILSI